MGVLAIAIAFSSCKKDDTDPEGDQSGNPVFTESFSAKVDGATFNETILNALEFTASSKIVISASANSSFPAIGLHMPNNIAPGTYTFNGSTIQGLYNVGQTMNDVYASAIGTGTLTITSHNTSTKQIEGTFSYVATPAPGNSNTNSFNITEGSFAVDYD